MKFNDYFSCGDLDGFFGLFIDNLLQLMLIALLGPAICGFYAGHGGGIDPAGSGSFGAVRQSVSMPGRRGGWPRAPAAATSRPYPTASTRSA